MIERDPLDELIDNLHWKIPTPVRKKVPIAPDLDDLQFASTWFAVLEYKTMLEQQLYALTRRAKGPMLHQRGLKKYQRLYLSNSPANIEDQAYAYATLAELSRTLEQWTPRAVEMDLF
jgi:hypothetical protein